MPIDEARFRQALGHFASGVTVITTKHEDVLYGMTLSSFASLSLRPPLVLICVDRSVNTYPAIEGAGHFVANILAQGQEHISRRFASSEADKFSGIAWQTGQLGLPVLAGVLAAIECRVVQQVPGGDHTIFVGEVLDAQVYDGMPLLYYRGGYHELK